MRGGPHSADHIDILGNVDMLADFLRIVSDFDVDDVRSSKIISDVREVAEQINSSPRGGVFLKKRGWP
jgi:hypothetical protein